MLPTEGSRRACEPHPHHPSRKERPGPAPPQPQRAPRTQATSSPTAHRPSANITTPQPPPRYNPFPPSPLSLSEQLAEHILDLVAARVLPPRCPSRSPPAHHTSDRTQPQTCPCTTRPPRSPSAASCTCTIKGPRHRPLSSADVDPYIPTVSAASCDANTRCHSAGIRGVDGVVPSSKSGQLAWGSRAPAQGAASRSPHHTGDSARWGPVKAGRFGLNPHS
eukprot:scaffold13751_cov108-Isochrysis_galbana.AAC.1